MKKYLSKILSVAAVIACATSAHAAETGKVYTQEEIKDWTEVESLAALAAGARFEPGVYVYGNTGVSVGYLYISGDSIYAGKSAGNQNSTVTTEQTATFESISAVGRIISARLDSRTGRNGGSSTISLLDTNGKNAGSAMNRFGVWVRGDYTRINDSTSGGKWHGTLWSVILGGDYRFNSKVIAGLGLTYGRLTGKTNFNNGKIAGDNSFGVVPYANFKVNRWMDVDALIGWMRTHKKRTRIDANGTTIKGNPKSDRWYGSLVANAYKNIRRMQVLGRLGYTYGQDKQKAFSEDNGLNYSSQDVKISRAFLEGQLGFYANESVMPYLLAQYNYDFKTTDAALSDGGPKADTVSYVKPKAHTAHGFQAGAGLKFLKNRNWSGGVEYRYGMKGSKLRTHNVNLRLRYEF